MGSAETADVLEMPAIWSARQSRHEPRGEVWVGVRIPGTDVPERGARLLEAVSDAGSPVVASIEHGDAVLRTVHEVGLIEHLATVWEAWEASGYLEDPGQDRVVPYAFPIRGAVATDRVPASVGARAGWFCTDTTTLIGPGTFEAAVAAFDCALTAVDVVRSGEVAAYAICRPPGHHAGRAFHGGSCYLNNAAGAAQALASDGLRVAIVDIDAHHGNGTQQIFYERGDVLYASVHVDPGAGWFPHFAGYADEEGSGDGSGANVNVPLQPGAGDEEWLDGVERACDAAARHEPDAVVVSLGVDAAAADPESPLRVTGEGYREAGRTLGGLGAPTVFVQEGGYHLETLGGLVVAALAGFESGAT